MFKSMEVHLTPAQEATLQQLAAIRGRRPVELVQELLASYLEDEARVRTAVQLSREQIKQGEGIPHEKVVASFQKRYGA